MKYPVRELLALIVGFLLFSFLLLGGVDALFGRASDDVGGVVAFLAAVPTAWLATRVIGRRPFRQILSAEGALWNGLSTALAVAIPVAVVAVAVGVFIRGVERMDTPLWMVALFLVMTPVMAWAEELLFRGWMPQFLGYWVKNPWIAFFLPAVPFAVIHAPSNAMMWVGHLVSGACFAYLAMRTQSLAASTVVHATSNTALHVLDYLTHYSGRGVSWGTEGGFIFVVKCVLLVLVTALIAWRPHRQGQAAENSAVV